MLVGARAEETEEGPSRTLFRPTPDRAMIACFLAPRSRAGESKRHHARGILGRGNPERERDRSLEKGLGEPGLHCAQSQSQRGLGCGGRSVGPAASSLQNAQPLCEPFKGNGTRSGSSGRRGSERKEDKQLGDGEVDDVESDSPAARRADVQRYYTCGSQSARRARERGEATIRTDWTVTRE